MIAEGTMTRAELLAALTETGHTCRQCRSRVLAIESERKEREAVRP